MTGYFHPHRVRHGRSCDRCRQPATWNYVRRGHLTEYACDTHAIAIAVRDEVDMPPIATNR